MIPYGKRHNTMQDVLNAIAKCAQETHRDDCTGEDFDKLSGHIYRLIEKVIYRCLGRLPDARKRLQAEGLEEYFDLYLELIHNVMKHKNAMKTTAQTVRKMWMMDIATIRMESGIRYLAVIMDDHAIVIGWSITNSVHPERIRQTLGRAISLHSTPEAIYTDRASIFSTVEHFAYLAKCEISRMERGKRKSVHTTIERFIGNLRHRHLHPYPQDEQELQERVQDYILDFNARHQPTA